MSGIPVFTTSAINASKASGVAPQTASSESNPSASNNEKVPATTTAIPSSTSSYPPARPGAAAVPAPTGSVQKYIPVQPTPTTKTSEGPPAPQPGAFPTPGNLPPPPKAGEAFQNPQKMTGPPPPTANAQPYPHQMSMPPPTTAYGAQPPTSSTSISTKPSSSYPVSLPITETTRRSIEHPPGYQQNASASETTSDQRRAQEANSSNLSLGGYEGSPGGSNTDSLWDTAKKWANSAGEKIAGAEEEVWRRINKQ